MHPRHQTNNSINQPQGDYFPLGFFFSGCRGRQPLPICAKFNLLVVGRGLAPAVFKNIIAICTGCRGRQPLRQKHKISHQLCRGRHPWRPVKKRIPRGNFSRGIYFLDSRGRLSLQAIKIIPNYKARTAIKPSPVGESCRKRLLSLLCKRQVARRMRCP